MSGFPTRTPAELDKVPREEQWLVEELWGRQSVGIIGGEPKCGKTFLALEFAVSVAAGVPCLRRFPVSQRGTVPMYIAEDGDHLVRWRLEDITTAAGVDFDTLDIALIEAPVMRLDHSEDCKRLRETVERVRPRLLVLDPMVRLHGGDENAVGVISPILGFLRELQRTFATAVVLVHHARKSGASRPGQALRGSSDFHAWGDSNLYLRRHGFKHVAVSVEHRGAASRDDLELEFADAGEGSALRLCQGSARDDSPRSGRTAEERILGLFEEATEPLTQREVRRRVNVRNETVSRVLRELVQDGRIARESSGYRAVVPAKGQCAKRERIRRREV